MHTRTTRRGLTLIEMMVVITIMGLLATVVGINVLGQGDRARIQLTKTQISNVDEAIKIFAAERGRLPDSMEDLIASDTSGLLDTEEVPVDAFGYEIAYTKTGSRTYTVVSLGADGVEGGEGVDADIDVRAAKRMPRKSDPK